MLRPMRPAGTPAIDGVNTGVKMFRRLPATSPREFGKWCAYALALLVPASFVVLAGFWLVRAYSAREPRRSGERSWRLLVKDELPMNDRESSCSVSFESKPDNIVQQLRRWWGRPDAEERYLAAATDHAELERRIRVLQRARGGPVFVTFNH